VLEAESEYSAETPPRIEVFERPHTVEEHEETGIGLALCQRTVERHGVGIWVESGYGRGATFSVTLSAVEITERQSL
jgi:light-regulated signal transduction histidine kinase (bacteriophytochrome)